MSTRSRWRLRRELERQRDEHADAFGRAVLDRNVEVQVAVQRELQTIEQVLRAMSRPGIERWGVPVGVALLCVTVAGLAWFTRVNRTRVMLAARTAYADFLTPGFTWMSERTFKITAVDVEGVTRVDAVGMPNLQLVDPDGRTTIEIPKGGVTLTALSIAVAHPDTPAVFTVEAAPDSVVALSVQHGIMEIHALLHGAVEVTAHSGGGPSRHVRMNVREDLAEGVVLRAGSRHHRGKITMKVTSPLSLTALAALSPSFIKRVATSGGDVTHRSALLDGELLLLDVDKKVSVSRHAYIGLENFSGEVAELALGDVAQITLTGDTRRARYGSLRQPRDLTPRRLEFLSKNQPLELFWSAVVFLWGAMWAARRLFAEAR